MGDTATVVKVGIADLNIVSVPDKIRTSGLGSCIGVVIYDLSNQMAGLAHVMLPDSAMAKQDNLNKYKYADTAIDILVDKLIVAGAEKFALKAKMAGGAQMFQFTSGNDFMRIGPRNAAAVEKRLKFHRIRLIAKDIGGNSGRTIEFDPETGKLHIRTISEGERVI
ncbi:chemotaxis protein CheD [Virgibacillus kekensis]|uniref:Probable chemoreceptor glutamine deamidase CheD n=1 Tax=Virgibacillus kekensis TaxID=202261 RepID=A0ABV9DEA1_9BACI